MDTEPLLLMTPQSNEPNDLLSPLLQQNLPSHQKMIAEKIQSTTKRNTLSCFWLVVVMLVLILLLLSWVMYPSCGDKPHQQLPKNADHSELQPPQIVGGDDKANDVANNKLAFTVVANVPALQTIVPPATAIQQPTPLLHSGNIESNGEANSDLTTNNRAVLPTRIPFLPTVKPPIQLPADDNKTNGEVSNKPRSTPTTDGITVLPTTDSLPPVAQPLLPLPDFEYSKKKTNEYDRLDEAFEMGRQYWNVNRARSEICENKPLSDNDINVYISTGNYEWRDSIYVALDPDSEEDDGNDKWLSAADADTTAKTTRDQTDKKKRKRKVVKKYYWKMDSEMFGQCSMFAMNDLRTVLIRLSKFGQAIAAIKRYNKLVNETELAAVVAESIDGKTFKLLLSTLRNVESYITQVIRHIHATLPNKTFRKKWTNWFQVSIIYPALLAYYLLIPYRVRLISTRVVLDQIRAIIISPYQSLGYHRDGSNAVAMYGPWLFALIYQHGCNESTYRAKIQQSYYYTKIADELMLPEQIIPLAEGWHRDGSFIAHKTCLGFGYLQMMCSPLTNYVYAFDTSIVPNKTPTLRWRELAQIILHPMIARGPPGILSRDSTFLSIVEPNATLGCEIMQFGKMLRISGNGGYVVVRGVHAGLGYFEADNANDRFAQYWVQARAPYTADMPIEIPPLERAYGIIFADSDTDYKRLHSRTSTTDIYYPNEISRCYVGVSVEGARERFLIQRYRIDEFGDYNVYELVRFSHAKPHISRSFIEIDNRSGSRDLFVRLSAEPVRPYNMNAKEARQRLTLHMIPRGEVYVIKHTMNVEEGTICSIISKSIENYKSRIPMWEHNEMLMVAGDEKDSWCIDVKRNVVTSNRYGDFSSTGPPNADHETSALEPTEHDLNNNQSFVWVKKLRSYMRVPRSKEEITAAKASPIRTLLSPEDDLATYIANNNTNNV